VSRYEQFLRWLIGKVQGNRALWEKTAVLVTVDESGGYWDGGYIQILDAFGDGTRIPLIAVSPFARKGAVDHTYRPCFDPQIHRGELASRPAIGEEPGPTAEPDRRPVRPPMSRPTGRRSTI
jgi:hypothetical protein